MAKAVTPAQSRTAYGVFTQFWSLINTGGDEARTEAVGLLHPGISVRFTRFGELHVNMALNYGKRWYKHFGQLGNPYLSEYVSVKEEGSSKKTVVVVLRCFYRKIDNTVRVVSCDNRRETDMTTLMVHTLTLSEDGRITNWGVMIEDEDLLDLMR